MTECQLPARAKKEQAFKMKGVEKIDIVSRFTRLRDDAFPGIAAPYVNY